MIHNLLRALSHSLYATEKVFQFRNEYKYPSVVYVCVARGWYMYYVACWCYVHFLLRDMLWLEKTPNHTLKIKSVRTKLGRDPLNKAHILDIGHICNSICSQLTFFSSNFCRSRSRLLFNRFFFLGDYNKYNISHLH